jgi:hypothetical protein
MIDFHQLQIINFSNTINKIKMNATKIISGKSVFPKKKNNNDAPTIGRLRKVASKTKTANEIRKDKQKSVPTAMLPMVF